MDLTEFAARVAILDDLACEVFRLSRLARDDTARRKPTYSTRWTE
jgi:hypothetical protein